MSGKKEGISVAVTCLCFGKMLGAVTFLLTETVCNAKAVQVLMVAG